VNELEATNKFNTLPSYREDNSQLIENNNSIISKEEDKGLASYRQSARGGNGNNNNSFLEKTTPRGININRP
jgi:hypothetical protein